MNDHFHSRSLYRYWFIVVLRQNLHWYSLYPQVFISEDSTPHENTPSALFQHTDPFPFSR